MSPVITAFQAVRQRSTAATFRSDLSLVASDRHLDASLSRDLEDVKQSSPVLRGESRPLLHSLGFCHLRSVSLRRG